VWVLSLPNDIMILVIPPSLLLFLGRFLPLPWDGQLIKEVIILFKSVVVVAMLLLITSCSTTYPNPKFGTYLVNYVFLDGPEAVKARCKSPAYACAIRSKFLCTVILDGNKPYWYKEHEKAHCFRVLDHGETVTTPELL